MTDSLHADDRMQRCAKHFRATGTAWSLSRVPGRPDSEPDDHRMRAHEAKVSVALQQQEVGRPTHSGTI